MTNCCPTCGQKIRQQRIPTGVLKTSMSDLSHCAVRRAVNSGRLPRISTVKCVDCGSQAQRYDHYLGYARENWLKVQPVCHRCDGLRMKARGENRKPWSTKRVGPRMSDGRFFSLPGYNSSRPRRNIGPLDQRGRFVTLQASRLAARVMESTATAQ